MITMIGHAMEATGFLFAGPLCEACERPLDQNAVIRSHRLVDRPEWQPSVLETRVRFVWLCAACGDDPHWQDWPPVSLEERETLRGLLAQIGLCAFVETRISSPRRGPEHRSARRGAGDAIAETLEPPEPPELPPDPTPAELRHADRG